MSNSHRIQQLLEFMEEEPENPFNVYALALEYQNHDAVKAGHYFNILLRDHGSYLPTYYHAAAFFAETGDLARAGKTYEEGIDLAAQNGDDHALRELKNAYTNFRFEND